MGDMRLSQIIQLHQPHSAENVPEDVGEMNGAEPPLLAT